ncbi:DNA topoisomerase 1 [Diospyros lotus]|uniref:DNA topoisomerase 1 n=1 Tax=Diospyros lotus TaxID=55363 RepID=UPI00224FB4DD|nr:DNA topoisomerase 1 [Diospyros lotus]XP_052178398.1 DNA topoisomerase 1 [Diospyros lotus]XP_052178399.1 DNA topoisomerase 1 [Diospyros lotus]
MAVEACMNSKMMDDMDDDDKPLVFKRSSTASRPNQLNSEAKKPASQRRDGQSGKQVSEVRSPNVQNSISQKGKVVPSIKVSQVKSPAASPKASTSSAKASAVKLPSPSPKPSTSPVNLPTANSKVSTSAADQLKHSSQPNTKSVKQEKQLMKSAGEPHSDSEDSEDDKPLSARLPARVSKGNANHGNRGRNTSSLGSQLLQKPRIKDEDSDDEIPLSSKFQFKPNAGPSTSRSSEFDGKKPVLSKLQQNGSSTKEGQLKKSATGLNKRPLVEAKSSSQSSVKRPKLEGGLSSPITGKQVSVKEEQKHYDDDDDHVPISQRLKKPSTSANKPLPAKQKVTKVVTSSFKKSSKKSQKVMKKSKYSKSLKVPPGSGEGQKWTTLVHNGVIFPPPYKPHGVKMLYKGKPVDLTSEQEEVATMFAVMLDTDYMNKAKFKENFFNDWRKILGKNHVIQRLDDCDFTPIYEWHQREKDKKKQMSSEEKKTLKEEKLKQEEKYMWAIVDGVKEKVGNFRVEPPGLFRGRGEHPKMGKLKNRIRPSDITINIGKDAPIPECPIPGESWKEIRNDNTVTWLAYWNDPINPKEFKYVFLAASSSLKGQSDKEKYEKARLLKDYIQGIRAAYTKDFTNKDITKRQIAVATYLIDKLALRAGNEKDDDEADTVGCCTLKVENVEPVPPNTLKFDFLGKDSIRYQNDVAVELPVFKAIQQFRTGKRGSDDLFDKLDTSKLNAHLKELMPGLTAKVFRTYNASITLDDMLSRETRGGDVPEKVVVYQHANKEVAIICNHQRTVSKTHSAQISRLNEKIDELKAALDELRTDLARAKKGKPPLKGADGKQKKNLNPEALERKIAQTTVKIEKMERDKETKEDLKTVALGTSKINYLDPRITVAWCKRHEVPIEKIFNKSLLAKFAWAMDIDPTFRF